MPPTLEMGEKLDFSCCFRYNVVMNMDEYKR
ncbi:hypothetical protein B23_1089 [Geobacillus thermoleovorans B23]|nr:hypothetical protein B23_1089 [Geobacillus thermoleovorans B23]